MQATIEYDTAMRRLLQPLLAVRHGHLLPLVAVRLTAGTIALHYGQPPACADQCDGLRGALRAVHQAGLWVGDVLESVGLDQEGRAVLTGVGSTWDLRDPFAGHPSCSGYDLRVRWRQRGDEQQLQQIEGALTQCA